MWKVLAAIITVAVLAWGIAVWMHVTPGTVEGGGSATRIAGGVTTGRATTVAGGVGRSASGIREAKGAAGDLAAGDREAAVVDSAEKLWERLASMKVEYRMLRGTAGYWRVGQDQSGVWWFISPKGEKEWLNCVTTVQPFQLARDANGAQFVSRDYDGGAKEGGDMKRWASATLARVRAAGFKGLGAWCNPAFHDLNVPMTRDLNLWKWVNGEKYVTKVYDPWFAPTVEKGAEAQVTKLRENRNLVGYYIDNELDWGDGTFGPRIYFDGLSNDNPNRVEVMKVAREVWGTVEAFNGDWGTNLKSWDGMREWTALPLSFGDDGRKGNYTAYIRLLSAWMEHVARDYFKTMVTAIRKYDRNHLVLGVRFKNWAPEEVVKGSRGWTDAVSLNHYVGDGKLDREMFEMIARESGQPLIITEYSFHALDGRSGNRNTVGFAGQVLDQRARAEGYKRMTTRLAEIPWVIGADWFQWADEPPTGRNFDGEDVNFGMVDVDDRPYEGMVAAVRGVAPLLNGMHAWAGTQTASIGTGGSSEKNVPEDVWRGGYAVNPVMRVPYLERAPVLNGELSEWSAECRLSDVKHSETIGLERSRVPLPNVYLGWREEGLYLAIEVFDDDIQGADPQGWWWTRDAVEWWIKTSPPLPKQNYYDGSCHQFFFVPSDFPINGVSGTVGQWHRPGDALKDNLVPHPGVKQASRVLPGRYVVEMLIPGEALKGWDPEGSPKMAFNLHVRNWQHAIDYYWSAPKEVQTQLRPSTWGTMYLMPR